MSTAKQPSTRESEPIMRHITSNGLKLIKKFEGFSSAIYLDSAGLPTVGYGHLIKPHEAALFKAGITEAKAEELLRQES